MHKINLKLRDVTTNVTTKATKKLNRRSFHFRYLELCRAKNLTPLSDIKSKNNCTSVLDFYGDKLTVNDWLLQTLGIRMRQSLGVVFEHLDTEKKAKLFRKKAVLYTKFIFSGVVEAVSNCIEFNKNLRILNLEGLPLNDKYVESIAKALSSNESLHEISFQRSNIGDKGCEAICNTIKYLENIEKLNLSECELTTKGAEFVADMVKVQKISRYTEGWQKSLRYRDVDPDTIPGLRSITLARNPQIADDGIKPIVEVLKEDVWIKVIDMESCGLTDRAANLILDCLEINNYIIDFNVRDNAGISKFLQRSIRERLGKEDEDQQRLMAQQQEFVTGPNGTVIKRTKVSVAALKEQLKTLEEQIAFERMLRRKAEQLNEKLNQQIVAYENQLECDMTSNIPDGYVIVKNESLQSIIKERHDFQKLVNRCVAVSTDEATPRNNIERAHQSTQDGRERTDPHNTTTSDLSAPPNNSPNLSDASLNQKDQRNALKVRKIKSEVKYVDPLPKDSGKRKVSKSDHEYVSECEVPLTSPVCIEGNIGDTLTNTTNRSTVSTVINDTAGMKLRSGKEKNVNFIYNKNNNNANTHKCNKNPYINVNKFELDELSMTTTRSTSSDLYSSDSDTLRNDLMDNRPLKVFIRRGKPVMPLTPMPNRATGNTQVVDETCGAGVPSGVSGSRVKSPRSLFLGLCDD